MAAKKWTYESAVIQIHEYLGEADNLETELHASWENVVQLQSEIRWVAKVRLGNVTARIRVLEILDEPVPEKLFEEERSHRITLGRLQKKRKKAINRIHRAHWETDGFEGIVEQSGVLQAGFDEPLVLRLSRRLYELANRSRCLIKPW